MFDKFFKGVEIDENTKDIFYSLERDYNKLLEVLSINGDLVQGNVYAGDNGKIYTIRGNKLNEIGSINNSGYVIVKIKLKNNIFKTYKRNRIIAETFLKDYNIDLLVDHINGIKIDDRVENLRMATFKENTKNKYNLNDESEINRLLSLKIDCLRTIDRIDKKISSMKNNV